MSLDLESIAACEQFAPIHFLAAEKHDLPIAAFEVNDALACAIAVKRYTAEIDARHQAWLNIGHQEFDEIRASTAGQLYLLEGAARTGKRLDTPVSIFVLRVANNVKLRWFWTVKCSIKLLQVLEREKLIGRCRTAEPRTTEHKKLYTAMSVLFDRVTSVPDAPKFEHAEQITDYAPDIDDPDTAWTRVYAQEYIYFNVKEPMRDMSDDRYAHHLHKAEEYIASYSHISAATYLLLKRLYFKDFFRELTLNRERINRAAQSTHSATSGTGTLADRVDSAGPQIPGASLDYQSHSSGRGARRRQDTPIAASIEIGTPPDPSMVTARTPIASRTRATTSVEPTIKMEIGDGDFPTIASTTRKHKTRPRRVRNESAHIDKIRHDQNWTMKRAKLLILGWTALGFLEEDKYIDWIDAGGMFETLSLAK